ncbi:MAG: hypothetical protein ACK5Y2_09015 [Bdellovibrionales bacterium]
MKNMIRLSQVKTILLLVFTLLLTEPAFSQSRGGGWNQRAQSRASKRWTLQEWLEQKDRMALMDQWLVMNSPSPYEFYLKGAQHSYERRRDAGSSETFQTQSGAFGAYAQAVGVTGEYENNWEENYNDVTGMLNLRVLGNSLQTTSLTFHVGQRTRQLWHQGEKETLRNILAQGSLQAYLTRFFGIQASYRHYFSNENRRLGDVEGTLTEGGVFLDFSGLRLFGSLFQDVQVEKLNSVETETKRTGYKTGLQIFF